MSYNIDSSHNVVLVSEPLKRFTYNGKPVVVVRLVKEPDHGYLAMVEEAEGGGFGNDEIPSSYGRAVITWFGPGERYKAADEAIARSCLVQLPVHTR